jgi:dihydroorotate dehydrogenase
MYQIIKPILFQLDPEKAHHVVFSLTKWSKFLLPFFFSSKINSAEKLKREVFGLQFKNPVGLAAGFDKNGVLIEELDALGFGFIEVGTVTPKPQAGNPKKRVFRLKKDEAIINRMGFNNEGVDALVTRLKAVQNKNIIIGGNIGKNKDTPNEEAVNDYLICFNKLFDHVHYFVVNVSSPNTPNLRALQDKEPLTHLLQTLQNENLKKSKPKPILLKIAPDLTDEQLLDIIDIVHITQIAGVIATNTTLSRANLVDAQKDEQGGLSGKPLTKRSTEVIKFLADNSQKSFPIIGVGGIHSAKDAQDKLNAGASLIQLYTGFVYEGPGLIKRINEGLKIKSLAPL